MLGKLEEDYLESQNKLNLSELYNNEEIKLLKKSIPDINNMIYLAANSELNSTKDSKIFNERVNPHQFQYRYFPPTRKIKSTNNNSFYIDKEKFFTLILEKTKQFLEQEKNLLLSKSISLIINEILNISRIIKQNIIYNRFFKSIKNPKIISYSVSKDKAFHNIKVNFNSALIKNNSKSNNKFLKRNIRINDNLKSYEKFVKKTEINSNVEVKKQLSFKTENEKIKKNNNSVCDINSIPKDKDKNIKDKSDLSSISKGNASSIKMNNKTKAINNFNEKKNFNISKKNLSYMNYSTNLTKPNKKENNNFHFPQSKISLKKANYGNKKLYEIMNNKDFKTEGNIVSQKKNIKKEKEDKNNSKSTNSKFCPPSQIDSNLYKNIETQEFNIFHLEKKIGRENILPLIGYHVFNSFNFGEIIKFDKFENWCKKISDGYIRKNYYHNDLHAADITQTCLLYFKMGEVDKVHNFVKSDLISLFSSCICHDYKHPGVNNNFLKETKNKLSIRYNDASILENMHISASFKLILSDKDCNIFENVDIKLYKEMRKQMISCVLATDMAFHNIYLEFLKKYIKEKNEGKTEEKTDSQKNEEHQKFMNILIHSADISNPTKLFDIYFEWAKLVVEEFWDQGDKEKNLNLVCSCDREKVTIYQSQLGFINFIEIPYFSLFAEITSKLKFFYDNLLNNKNILLSMQEKEKEKKNKSE